MMEMNSGDLLPDLVADLAGQDGPVNLTSATKVEVVGYRDGVEVLRRVVTGDAQGKVVMPWQTGDTGVGTLGVRWEVTSGEKVQTFPPAGFEWVRCNP